MKKSTLSRKLKLISYMYVTAAATATATTTATTKCQPTTPNARTNAS
jgi:hypothetical protein